MEAEGEEEEEEFFGGAIGQRGGIQHIMNWSTPDNRVNNLLLITGIYLFVESVVALPWMNSTMFFSPRYGEQLFDMFVSSITLISRISIVNIPGTVARLTKIIIHGRRAVKKKSK